MATQEDKPASDLGQQAIALAEQLGRIAGMLEGRAEAWVNRPALTEQLTRVRDGAAELLGSLTNAAQSGRSMAAQAASAVGVGRGQARAKKQKSARPAPAATARSADPAHAPGKRRRKPAPTKRGIKKSDESIPKLRTATAVRQRRKSYA
jgi:hypothetical protein